MSILAVAEDDRSSESVVNHYDRYTAHIALICDTAYIVPTCTAISSLVRSAKADSMYDIIVVTAELSDEARLLLEQCAGENADVRVVTGDMTKFANLHIDTENSVRVASAAALLKFDLPTLLPELDKVLYLDGDIVVRDDLSELYATDITSGGYLVAAVADSGQIYFHHEYIDKVQKYFNSGVMLLNLNLMRQENTPELLLEEKRANPQSNLMDQNVFNVVMDGRVRYLEPKYNMLYMNLCHACQHFTMEQFNALFGTDYADLDGFEQDAVIVHYSSKNKPWKTECTVLSDEWMNAFLHTPCHEVRLPRYDAKRRPMFSIIVYMHNCEPYITQCIQSIKGQTLADFEVLLVENDSTDNTLRQAKQLLNGDERFKCLRLSGSSCNALNCALRSAYGEHVLFLEGFERLYENSLEHVADVMQKKNADMLSFGIEMSVSDRDGIIHTYPGAKPDCKLSDPVAVCLDCELGGWPRVYRRSWLEKFRLRFLNLSYRGEEFALRAAQYADVAVRMEETCITRLFDYMKKPAECSGSYSDGAAYWNMLQSLADDRTYGEAATRRMNEVLDIFCAARSIPSEQAKPLDSYGAMEKVLFNCIRLEQNCRKYTEQKRKTEEKYADVINSTSYKVGMKVTALPRYIKQKLKELRSEK